MLTANIVRRLSVVCFSSLIAGGPTKQMSLTNAFANRELLLLDGGTGEELFRRGVPDDRKIWSATALVNSQYHSVLEDVHRSFIEAGSHAITTNSYGVVPGVGFDDHAEVGRLCKLAGQIARRAASEDNVLVLGSLGPLLESYRADRIMEHEEGVSYYKTMMQAMLRDVDAWIAETSAGLDHCRQVIDAEKELSTQLPVLISYTLNDDGTCLRDGTPVARAILETLDMASSVNLQGILFNCAQPEAITAAFQKIQRDLGNDDSLKHVRFGAYANRLTPIESDWSLSESEGPQPFRRDLQPSDYASVSSTWVNGLGVSMIGGCCGMGPEHIRALRDKLLSYVESKRK